MLKFLFLFFILFMIASGVLSQTPPIEPGVSQELAQWRAARYSDVRYKLSLTLEKMSPVLRGTIEIRVNVGTRTPSSAMPGDGTRTPSSATPAAAGESIPIVLDWRKIRGHEEKSTISNVTINGQAFPPQAAVADGGVRVPYEETKEHLIFREGVLAGENVIKLDFTSPILTSGSALTRYVDKEDGSEYLYSLFVPSDASTAFPVFDQPDLKARFQLDMVAPIGWQVVTNTNFRVGGELDCEKRTPCGSEESIFYPTKPISTYVFAFAAGPWEKVSVPGALATGSSDLFDSSFVCPPNTICDPVITAADLERLPTVYVKKGRIVKNPVATASGTDSGVTVNIKSELKEAYKKGSTTDCCGIMTAEEARVFNGSGNELQTNIYVRKSQAAKFKPHAAEVFRLNREAIRYFEEYFDYKFPFPKYDLVLIPEFPFGGMEHAGATFLKESSVIFPQEPTKNDHITRATLIFHETAHQWFGDTVTMRWFDDLWLKEGFATFMGYKALEKIMPEMNAWKVFYERIKQGAYQTDSTRGTTAIYQPIANLSNAKSAYGNIVYNKAPAFLRQAEFYLGEDKFQTAVRAFLKKHEFGNATWEDLVREFEAASSQQLDVWANQWVTQRGMYVFHSERHDDWHDFYDKSEEAPPLIAITPIDILRNDSHWKVGTKVLMRYPDGSVDVQPEELYASKTLGGRTFSFRKSKKPVLIFPNYGDYGYGIFLLDEKSRDHVLKNIQNEKDPFLRSMMWGALWDSVREGELDPREYVELVIKQLGGDQLQKPPLQKPARSKGTRSDDSTQETDETIVSSLLGRVSTALNYYLPTGALTSVRTSAPGDLRTRLENVLIERMQNAETAGQRITFYRALLNIASTENARSVLKRMLAASSTTPSPETGATPPNQGGEFKSLPLRTKDRFDIVTRLLILNDPDAPKLLAELEKTETSDDAKRYAYAAKAGIPTAENKARYWNDFVNNKEISESWIEAAFGPWNSIRHSELTLPYLQKALQELPNHKRNRKIFFVNGWLGAFIGGQRSEEALSIVSKFLAENPTLDNDLRLKILENVDLIERAVKIRSKFEKKGD